MWAAEVVADSTENWFPLRRTTGVLPFSPQVRPVTRSERMPTWSANRISPPSVFAFARILGQVSPGLVVQDRLPHGDLRRFPEHLGAHRPAFREDA